eukprot:1591094-Amphidinium_carterae.1
MRSGLDTMCAFALFPNTCTCAEEHCSEVGPAMACSPEPTAWPLCDKDKHVSTSTEATKWFPNIGTRKYRHLLSLFLWVQSGHLWAPYDGAAIV